MRFKPDRFLNSTYLKYIGWLLNDKNEQVRCESLRALSLLVEDEVRIVHRFHCRVCTGFSYVLDTSLRSQQSFYPILESTLRRFSRRLLEITKDVDDNVSILAVQLCGQLFQGGLFTDSEKKPVYKLAVEDTSKKVRGATGTMVGTLVNIPREVEGPVFKRSIFCFSF